MFVELYGFISEKIIIKESLYYTNYVSNAEISVRQTSMKYQSLYAFINKNFIRK